MSQQGSFVKDGDSMILQVVYMETWPNSRLGSS